MTTFNVKRSKIVVSPPAKHQPPMTRRGRELVIHDNGASRSPIHDMHARFAMIIADMRVTDGAALTELGDDGA